MREGKEKPREGGPRGAAAAATAAAPTGREKAWRAMAGQKDTPGARRRRKAIQERDEECRNIPPRANGNDAGDAGGTAEEWGPEEEPKQENRQTAPQARGRKYRTSGTKHPAKRGRAPATKGGRRERQRREDTDTEPTAKAHKGPKGKEGGEGSTGGAK